MITNVADLLYPTYNAILNYMPFSDVAFRAKMLTGQIPGWRGIPDEEVPFAQYPIAIVDPPFQDVSLDDFASVTGVLSKKTASNPGVGIVSYAWDWGDGSTSTGVSVTHKYTSIGDFVGSLTVTDSNGLTDIASFHVRVTSEKTYRTLYAITEAMELAVTFDDGWNWRVYNLRSWKQLIGMRGRAVAVHPDNRLMAWFGDNTGRIWYTTDGLLSVPDPLAILPTGIVDIAVEPYTGSNLLVLCEDGFLYVVPTTTYTDTIVVKQLIHLDGVPVAVSISDANSNLWAAAAGTKYYISRNYGQTWNAYDVPGGVSITAMDFSRMSRKYLSIATQKSAFVIDVDSGNVVKGLSNVQVPVIGISNLPRSVDGVVVALGEAASIPLGLGVQNIYKSDPFGTINSSAVFPLSPAYAKNLLADRASQNKFWYTYNYEIFKSYAIANNSYPTSSLIELGTFVMDIAQGPLINSYDNFDFPTPTFPFPKFPIPEFPTIDVPPFNFPPLYFPIPPFYIPPFYPCYDIDGNYDCLPPPYEIPPGYYEPYAPGFPPIYPPNGPGWPTLPEIPIGPLDPPIPPIIPWGDPGEDPRDDIWNVFCETGVSGAEFITDGHPDWVGPGPSGGGYLKMTTSHIESLWPPAGYSGTDKVNCWMMIGDPGPNNFWMIMGWKMSGCDAPTMMGLYVSRQENLAGQWTGKLTTSNFLPHYKIPDDGVPARSISGGGQISFGPEDTIEGPGGKFWPVLRAIGGTFNYFRGPHWIGQGTASFAFSFDPNKWYRWSMRQVNETVFYRVETASGNSKEYQYWYRDYDLRYNPFGGNGFGAWLAKLADSRNLVSFWGSPRKNLYTDPVPGRTGGDTALYRNHAVDDEHDPVVVYIDNPAFGYTGPMPHDPDDPLPPAQAGFPFYLGEPSREGVFLDFRSV